MKTLVLIIGFFCTLCSVKSQSIMVGGAVSYGSDINQFAPNIRVYYGPSEHLCFGPEFSYFPKVMKGHESIQLNEYGFVAHYIFDLKEKIGLYPLLGINYGLERSIISKSIHTEDSFGAAIGAGFHLYWNNILPFAEYQYITGRLSQSKVSIGIIYNFHLKKHSHTNQH